MNKQSFTACSAILLASLTVASGAFAAGLPTLPSSTASFGQTSAAMSGVSLSSASPRIVPAALAAPSVADSLSPTSFNAALPGLDGLGQKQAFASKTNAIRPIRVPGGGHINIPLPLPIPGTSGS